jgi:hypothetical protein
VDLLQHAGDQIEVHPHSEDQFCALLLGMQCPQYLGSKLTSLIAHIAMKRVNIRTVVAKRLIGSAQRVSVEQVISLQHLELVRSLWNEAVWILTTAATLHEIRNSLQGFSVPAEWAPLVQIEECLADIQTAIGATASELRCWLGSKDSLEDMEEEHGQARVEVGENEAKEPPQLVTVSPSSSYCSDDFEDFDGDFDEDCMPFSGSETEGYEAVRSKTI